MGDELRWIIKDGKTILQTQKYGIPPEIQRKQSGLIGNAVVAKCYYWEDVPTIIENNNNFEEFGR